MTLAKIQKNESSLIYESFCITTRNTIHCYHSILVGDDNLNPVIINEYQFLPANKTPLGLTFPSLILTSTFSGNVCKIFDSETVSLTPSQMIVAIVQP